MKKTLLTPLLLLSFSSFAQLEIQCTGADQHAVYLNASSGFYRIDSVDAIPSTPVLVANNPTAYGGGIGIANNLSTGSGMADMYYIDYNGSYQYWNGSSWINTLLSAGSPSSNNIGGSYNYLYNLDGTGGTLYRYDGTTNTPIFSYAAGSGNQTTYDVAADQQDNVYIMFNTSQLIVVFNSSGVPIDTFTTSGFVSGAGSGLAIVGNNFYATASTTLYRGVVSGHAVTFSPLVTLPFNPGDIASCPQSANVLAITDHERPHAYIYPNPVSAEALIKLMNAAELQLCDTRGKIIAVASVSGLNEYRLPVSHLPEGIYLLHVINKGNSSAVRLVVRR